MSLLSFVILVVAGLLAISILTTFVRLVGKVLLIGLLIVLLGGTGITFAGMSNYVKNNLDELDKSKVVYIEDKGVTGMKTKITWNKDGKISEPLSMVEKVEVRGNPGDFSDFVQGKIDEARESDLVSEGELDALAKELRGKAEDTGNKYFDHLMERGLIE